MITGQKNEQLLEVSRLKGDVLPEPFQPHRGYIDILMKWVHSYLCRPHPELGRNGPVCPFVPTSLEKKLFFITLYNIENPATAAAELRSIVLAERDRFLEMEPRRGNNAQYKTILLLFPMLPEDKAPQLIETIQEDLQEDFVSKGLMVGEFHAGPPNKRGLWNEDFRPLECPIPMLAIRHMVPTDILFLKDSSSLITEYLRIYGDMVPAKFKKYIEEAAEKFGFDLPDHESAISSAPTVIYLLEKNKIPYSVYRHSVYSHPIKKPADFAGVLNYRVDRITKALFLRDPDRRQYLITVSGADKKVNFKTLANFLGLASLELADREELDQRVGHPPLAVTPIGVKGIPTFMDKSLFQFPTILTGAGVSKMEIEIAPNDLKLLSNAEVLAFAE